MRDFDCCMVCVAPGCGRRWCAMKVVSPGEVDGLCVDCYQLSETGEVA